MPLVAPFFRASAPIGVAERRLFMRGLTAADFEGGLKAAGPVLRQNVRRLFAAAMLADSLGAPLVLVEGWRSNPIGKDGRRPRFVTGSWWMSAWLRLLHRRGLASRVVIIRRDVSRCTWEEARAIAGVASSRPEKTKVIGVSDSPCPSALRAARYLRGGSVITPGAALARATPLLTPDQQRFWNAVQPRASERHLAALLEAPNWVVHLVSEAARLLVPDPPLEQRLAAALRADR
jgi:hypothetical protein